MTRPTDITGQRFGRLVAVSPVHSAFGKLHWLCQCDCGKTSTPSGKRLRNGQAASCGCGQREALLIPSGKRMTHGHSRRGARHPLYGMWNHMTRRCLAPSADGYESYGGRGISVCDRWLGCDGFANFIADVGERPPGTSLDRINVNGNYEPANVRWATPKQQARNKRNTVVSLEMEREIRVRLDRGERQADIARSLGVAAKPVYTVARLARLEVQPSVDDGQSAFAMSWGVL